MMRHDPIDICRWQHGGWYIDGRPPGRRPKRGGLVCDTRPRGRGRPSGSSHTAWCSRPCNSALAPRARGTRRSAQRLGGSEHESDDVGEGDVRRGLPDDGEMLQETRASVDRLKREAGWRSRRQRRLLSCEF